MRKNLIFDYQIFLKQKYGGPSRYFVELNNHLDSNNFNFQIILILKKWKLEENKFVVKLKIQKLRIIFHSLKIRNLNKVTLEIYPIKIYGLNQMNFTIWKKIKIDWESNSDVEINFNQDRSQTYTNLVMYIIIGHLCSIHLQITKSAIMLAEKFSNTLRVFI